MKKRKQLHVSALNTLSDCGERFRRIYIMGERRKPSAFTIAGTGVHKGIEHDLLHKIDTSVLLPEDEVTDLVVQEVENKDRWVDISFDSEDDKTKGKEKLIGETKDRAVKLVKVHHREIAPNIDPLPRSEQLPNGGVSRRFAISLDGWLRDKAKSLYEQADRVHDAYAKKHLESVARSLNSAAKDGYDFAGEIDIQHTRNGEIWIRDSKTASKSPAKVNDKYVAADKSDQLSAYALAVKVLDGQMPAGVALDFLVDTETPKKVICESTRSEADIEIFLSRIIAAVHTIKTGSFTPARADWWGCSQKWCGFWHNCPYRSLK